VRLSLQIVVINRAIKLPPQPHLLEGRNDEDLRDLGSVLLKVMEGLESGTETYQLDFCFGDPPVEKEIFPLGVRLDPAGTVDKKRQNTLQVFTQLGLFFTLQAHLVDLHLP
jgi:hypothetical protein